MKRFVTYLYECERGNKSKNMGFIRVNVRGYETTMEVYIRNYLRSDDKGKLYALIYKNNLFGIELGEIKIANGRSDSQMAFQTNNMMESGASLNDIVGIGIRLDSKAYIASCWKDEYVDEIIRGEFQTQEDYLELEEEIEEMVEEVFMEESPWKEPADSEMQLEVAEESHMVHQVQNSDNNYQETNFDKKVTYTKIDLSQIRELPRPNWHFTTNSFLVHGFWNYGYLVLKKEMEKDKEKLSLGVPGIFEKPEMVMAMVFGFPTFAEIPEEMVEADMNQELNFLQNKKNQETKVGMFGCWFVELQD